MKRTWIALLALALAAPVLAQDEPAEEAEPADAAVEEAPAEEAAAEDAPAEEAAADEATEPAAPWALYVGVDEAHTRLSLSDPATTAADEFDSAMLRVRVGKRLFEAVGAELHVGIDQSDEDTGELKTDSYYGFYLVPTARLWDALELAFPVGYGRTEFSDEAGSGESEAYGSIAYGVSLELPIRVFWDALPDVRLGGGAMVYYQKSDARVYGANFGLRYDFEL